jgi:hydrogenase maturation protease
MNEWEFNLLEDKPSLESATIGKAEVRIGDHVRLCPRDGGDIFDLALAGKIATVESIEQDYEGRIHLGVVVDDDPGRDIGMMRQPGHRFFFSSTEIEPLERDAEASDGAAPIAETAANKTPSILVAGIGNIFLGDDAFGVEVVQRFAARALPAGVRVIDFGIRGFDLTYALIDGADVTILVDACPRGGTAGDLYVIEPDLNSPGATDSPAAAVDAHGMNPMSVIRTARAMGGSNALKKILLLGCEPQTLGPEEGQMGLSDPVADAVERAIPLLESLVNRIRQGEFRLEDA